MHSAGRKWCLLAVRRRYRNYLNESSMKVWGTHTVVCINLYLLLHVDLIPKLKSRRTPSRLWPVSAGRSALSPPTPTLPLLSKTNSDIDWLVPLIMSPCSLLSLLHVRWQHLHLSTCVSSERSTCGSCSSVSYLSEYLHYVSWRLSQLEITVGTDTVRVVWVHERDDIKHSTQKFKTDFWRRLRNTFNIRWLSNLLLGWEPAARWTNSLFGQISTIIRQDSHLLLLLPLLFFTFVWHLSFDFDDTNSVCGFIKPAAYTSWVHWGCQTIDNRSKVI